MIQMCAKIAIFHNTSEEEIDIIQSIMSIDDSLTEDDIKIELEKIRPVPLHFDDSVSKLFLDYVRSKEIPEIIKKYIEYTYDIPHLRIGQNLISSVDDIYLVCGPRYTLMEELGNGIPPVYISINVPEYLMGYKEIYNYENKITPKLTHSLLHKYPVEVKLFDDIEDVLFTLKENYDIDMDKYIDNIDEEGWECYISNDNCITLNKKFKERNVKFENNVLYEMIKRAIDIDGYVFICYSC